MSSEYSGERYVEVPFNRWGYAQEPKVLETTGLGSCVGIATFCPARKIGHMSHFPNPDLTPSLLDEFLASIKEKSDRIESVLAWIRGNDPHRRYEESLFDTTKSRNFVEDRVFELGLASQNVDIAWSRTFEVVDMTLDCSTGVFASESNDISNDPRYKI